MSEDSQETPELPDDDEDEEGDEDPDTGYNLQEPIDDRMP